MKKQAAKKHNPVIQLNSPPARGSKAWVSTTKHPHGALAVLSLADGTVVACTFIHNKKMPLITKAWQRQYPQLLLQQTKAPKAANLKKSAPIGTPFQRAVWLAISFIPSGCVAAYGDIAAAIGRPKAVRAVGTAVGKNPLAPLIPCHRVVGSQGNLGGYSCDAPDPLAVKRRLLKAEGVIL